MRHTDGERVEALVPEVVFSHQDRDRKSTRLNSSHPSISYAVFCLKKKNKHKRKVNRRGSASNFRGSKLCSLRNSSIVHHHCRAGILTSMISIMSFPISR